MAWKRLCKYISELIFRRNMSHTKSTIMNLILNKVKIYCNMLHSRVKNWIGTELCGTNIIIVNDRTTRKCNTEINEKITNEIKFSNNIGNRSILCLSRRPSHSLLLFRTPGYLIFTQINNMSIGGAKSIIVPSPVSVKESM